MEQQGLVLAERSVTSSIPVRGRMLQRKCACGKPKTAPCACNQQTQSELHLKRSQEGAVGSPQSVPPQVNEVLQSSGQPLNRAARDYMQPRFGQDFSQVRVHADAKSASSAEAVNAQAYTFGRHIVFNSGQYQPGTSAGRELLAHELTHVMQQRSTGGLPQAVAPPDHQGEVEADSAARRINAGLPLAPVKAVAGAGVMRKLKAKNPKQKIPRPGGKGLDQTNAETVEIYLKKLSPKGNIKVDRGSGDVSMDRSYCPGFVGGLVQGAKSAYKAGNFVGSIGGRIPVLGPVLGGILGFFGAIGGAIAGLFGARLSAASASKTPTGSNCICDFVFSRKVTEIELNDQETPAGAATIVQVPSPNNPKEFGATNISGTRTTIEPWLILGHELCGHAWLAIHSPRDEEGEKNAAPTADYIVDPKTGAIVPNPKKPHKDQFLRHGRTVEIENRIRKEHGIEPRGSLLKDPYCGESFWRMKGVSGPSSWQAFPPPHPTIRSHLQECEHMRRKLPENKNGQYQVHQRIP